MSFLVYCLLLVLYLHASNARQIGIINREFHGQNYRIFGKDLVRDHVKRGIHQKDLTPSNAASSLFTEKEDTQGYERISSQVVLQDAAKIKEWKRQTRILPGPKSHNAEETVDSKENDSVVEDIVVMDYTQPHRKTPIHNRKF